MPLMSTTSYLHREPSRQIKHLGTQFILLLVCSLEERSGGSGWWWETLWPTGAHTLHMGFLSISHLKWIGGDGKQEGRGFYDPQGLIPLDCGDGQSIHRQTASQTDGREHQKLHPPPQQHPGPPCRHLPISGPWFHGSPCGSWGGSPHPPQAKSDSGRARGRLPWRAGLSWGCHSHHVCFLS